MPVLNAALFLLDDVPAEIMLVRVNGGWVNASAAGVVMVGDGAIPSERNFSRNAMKLGPSFIRGDTTPPGGDAVGDTFLVGRSVGVGANATAPLLRVLRWRVVSKAGSTVATGRSTRLAEDADDSLRYLLPKGGLLT